MKILVTGIAGLLGSHLSRYLLDNDYEVCGIDSLLGGYKDFLDDRIIKNNAFYEMDLLDASKLEEIFLKEKPEIVFHLAAYAAVGLSPFIRNFNYNNNVIASINVINQCIKHDAKIIFTSSMSVYGIGNPPYTESQIPDPVDPYGIAKYAVEMDLKQAYDQFGLRYSIIRPHNVVGIYQNIWDKYRNVIGIWIRQILNDEPTTIYGDGMHRRAFSDIQFYLEPFRKLIDGFDREIFNIGADKEFKLIEVNTILCDIARKYNFNPKTVFLEPRLEVKDAFSNHDLAKDKLGFEDQTDIYSIIESMFVWAMTQPKREVKMIPYEVEKNMYSYWKK